MFVAIKDNSFYHISSPSNIPSILENGIVAGVDGKIFLLDTEEQKIVASVALLQCGYQDYALFRVETKALSGQLMPDNVGELTTSHQFILKQDLIASKYVSLVDCYRLK